MAKVIKLKDDKNRKFYTVTIVLKNGLELIERTCDFNKTDAVKHAIESIHFKDEKIGFGDVDYDRIRIALDKDAVTMWLNPKDL